MAKVSLAVLDRDDFFVDKFSRYALEHNNFFDVITFTDIAYLLNYLPKHKAGIIFVESEIYDEKIKEISAGALIVLSDGYNGEEDGIPVVNKYQKSENILKDLKFLYAESKGDKSIVMGNSINTAAIGVYSPIGGSGKTSIAAVLSAILAEKGFNTAYINLEQTSSEGSCFDTASAASVSELFLKLKNGSPNLSFDIAKSFARDLSNVMYMGISESIMEYEELNDEEVSRFVSEILKLGDIDFAVFDFDCEFSARTSELLKMMNIIIFPINDSSLSQAKLAAFTNEINIRPEMNIIWEKIIAVANKANGNNISDNVKFLFGEKGIYCLIPYNASIQRLSGATQLKNFFAPYLNRLADEIIRNR